MRKASHRKRFLTLNACFLVILVILVWRMVTLMVLDRGFLQGQGDARSVRVVDTPAFRGMIFDRQGDAIAVSTPVQSLWLNPKKFKPTPEELKRLASILNRSPQSISRRVSHVGTRGFVYLKRHLTPSKAQKIEALHIPGVNFKQEFKRYYPEAESLAQLIGFTNIDDDGIEGLELAYHDWLDGVPGKRRVIKDRTGRIIDELGVIQEPRPGRGLQLSIDRRIQFLAYHELQKTAIEFGAKSGSVVVLDARDGEVLAAVNWPSFNPNARQRYDVSAYRNRAMTDMFEPGSVIKPFGIASALETGLFEPDTVIDTRPSWMMLEGHAIRDVGNYGVLDVRGVLQHSSNVGMTKMVLASPPEHLIDFLKRCGAATVTASGYPGESEGTIVNSRETTQFMLATLSFGYGVSMTTLQLAKMYTVFANAGRLMPVSLLHSDEKKLGEQVLSPKISEQVLDMMESVVKRGGTGTKAAVPGYRVAGKTGTARIAGQHGYEEKRYLATFAGIAPVSHPRLVVAVVINEPTKKSFYGGRVAAPLFSKVMEASLRLLNIESDETNEARAA
ncbi:MAG: penicillin-binding protein 2 [Gammaproteobacteria bacterium]|nr:penicillin-binding protein 2 [Gammaproteobacteria bacterium]MCH9716962.1 penicillin-binding protein 2 [Gammaproteobacteria bacterium]MCH9762780.1 penicillin-binding protein 2 [Gammaproteobacteria bacterium]